MDEGLKLDGDVSPVEQLFHGPRALEELPREGERRVGRGGGLGVGGGGGVVPSDPELEIPEVNDVSLRDLGANDPLVVDEGAVPALAVADVELSVPLEDLRVHLGNAVGGQHQLQPRLPSDAERQRLHGQASQGLGALGDALQDEAPFRSTSVHGTRRRGLSPRHASGGSRDDTTSHVTSGCKIRAPLR